MRKLYSRKIFYVPVLLWALTLLSCSSAKHIKYFEDLSDSTLVTKLGIPPFVEPTIQNDDILSINIQTLDPQSTESINLGNIQTSGTGTISGAAASLNPMQASGYLVDKEGNVDIPILGKVKVIGLTTSQAKELIRQKAALSFKEPIVNVRYTNFKISVTGEVAHPAVYVVPNEKVSILDALTMAGDLTIYGKRDNVLLIREGNGGEKIAYRVNLNSSKVINSPYFYLRQNDLIYVEPTKGKAAANDLAQTRNVTILTSLFSLLIIIASRL